MLRMTVYFPITSSSLLRAYRELDLHTFDFAKLSSPLCEAASKFLQMHTIKLAFNQQEISVTSTTQDSNRLLGHVGKRRFWRTTFHLFNSVLHVIVVEKTCVYSAILL
jgi:hypothetical protein